MLGILTGKRDPIRSGRRTLPRACSLQRLASGQRSGGLQTVDHSAGQIHRKGHARQKAYLSIVLVHDLTLQSCAIRDKGRVEVHERERLRARGVSCVATGFARLGSSPEV